MLRSCTISFSLSVPQPTDVYLFSIIFLFRDWKQSFFHFTIYFSFNFFFKTCGSSALEVSFIMMEGPLITRYIRGIKKLCPLLNWQHITVRCCFLFYSLSSFSTCLFMFVTLTVLFLFLGASIVCVNNLWRTADCLVIP